MLIHYILFSTLTCLLTSQLLGSFNSTFEQDSNLFTISKNYAGLAMPLKDAIPYFNSPLLRGYIDNSRTYGKWQSSFEVYLIASEGYVFNCSIQNNTPCLFQMQGNKQFFSLLGNFSYQSLSASGLIVGWDFHVGDLDSDEKVDSFHVFYQTLLQYSNQSCGVDIVAKGDLITNYNATQYLIDAMNATREGMVYSSDFVYGPGVTDSASPQWYINQNITGSQFLANSVFTAQAVIFKNRSQLTISNLLSDEYSKHYIANRFDISSLAGAQLSVVSLIEGEGIDGVSNSFAAAIWLLGFAMEWSTVGGQGIRFFTNITDQDYKSVLGPAPLFKPTPLYYSMLLISILINQNAQHFEVLDSAGVSSSLKAWGFNGNAFNGMLLLNKDTNDDLFGDVQIVLLSKSNSISCIYLEAPSLNATDGVRLGGVTFQSGSVKYQGNYQQFEFTSQDNTFLIPFKYAQVVYCITKSPINVKFPVYSSERILHALILFIVIIYQP